MQVLKLIWQTTVGLFKQACQLPHAVAVALKQRDRQLFLVGNLVKQAWLLPQTVALALQQRRPKLARQQFETERLHRIRNPSKYAGR
jgi:hypothetical protein